MARTAGQDLSITAAEGAEDMALVRALFLECIEVEPASVFE